MSAALTPNQRLIKAHVWLSRTPETAQYSILNIGEVTVTPDKCATACTNGRDIWYNPDFINSINDDELRFLILHEASHIAWRHPWLLRKLPDRELAMQAADFCINGELMNIHPEVQFIEGGLYDSAFEGLSSFEIYKILEQEKLDGHPSRGGDADDIDWEGSESIDQETLAADITSALHQGRILAGKLGGGQSRAFTALLAPVVDWREQLRDWLTAACRGTSISTWSRPARRYLGLGMYMPSQINEAVGSIVIGVDASGSINNADLAVFMSEVKSILETVTPEQLDLIYWDTEVQRIESYFPETYDTLIESTQAKGGGGSNATCVFEHIKTTTTQPIGVIILSDGFIQFPPMSDIPTLWAITSNVTAPWGVTVRVKR